jgi:hypothetical protein
MNKMNKRMQIAISIIDEDGKTVASNESAVPYIGENPEADIVAILSEHNSLRPALDASSNRELEKFIKLAKSQGTKMPFASMEMGILAAGRKDMQNGLAEVLNSLGFDKPDCPECNEGMVNNGRGKKKS